MLNIVQGTGGSPIPNNDPAPNVKGTVTKKPRFRLHAGVLIDNFSFSSFFFHVNLGSVLAKTCKHWKLYSFYLPRWLGLLSLMIGLTLRATPSSGDKNGQTPQRGSPQHGSGRF